MKKYYKKLNIEYHKKIEGLEKRIEFLLESDLNLITMSQDKLRRCLTDLMKENENNKRDLELKNKERARLHEKINSLNFRLSRMSMKFENIKNEKTNTEYLSTEYQEKEKNKTDPLNSFSIISIPKNLDFRISSLKTEYSSFIYNINTIRTFLKYRYHE